MSTDYWVVLAFFVLLLVIWRIRLQLNAEEPSLSSRWNLVFTGLIVLLVGLVAWSGALALKTQEVEAVWTAVRPLAVGQAVQQSDLLARPGPANGRSPSALSCRWCL